MKEKLDISIVVPAYNEEESLPELCQWISRVMESHGFSYEVLMIDDGSTDRSWEQIVAIHQTNPHCKGIRFNRNYGKSAALQTGFRASRGRVVITMDADLQDSPDEIPELYRMITEQRFQLVSGWKKKRNDPISKTIPSKFFNYVTRAISGIKLHDFNCGLKAYDSVVVKNISVYGEMHRYIPVIAKWAGFKRIGEKVVEHRARKYGYTKFGLERFVNGFLDLLSITFVSRFRQKPMHFFGLIGSVSFLLGFLFTIKIFWDKMYALYFAKVPLQRDVTDQPLFYLALVALVIGVQLFVTGFLAEMLAMQSASKRDYFVIENVGVESSGKVTTM
jgi:glycosyltransferase involved in cell wall biosynthesis